MADIAGVLKELQQERDRLDKAIAVLRKLAGSTGVSAGRKPARKRRALSAAARRKIAAAQRARWAKWKAARKKTA